MQQGRSSASGNLRDGALVAAAAVLFAFEALAVRAMTDRGIPVGWQLFARAAGQLVWIAPMLLRSGVAVFHTHRPGLHLMRGCCSLTTWGFYFLSFGHLDLATATVLSFTNVMFTTMLAGPVLGERVGLARWAGTLAGLIGVAVMLRPGTQVSMLGVVLALTSAATWCGITLSSRVLTRTERNETIVAWVGLVTTIGVSPLALASPMPQAAGDLLLMAVFALGTPGIIWLLTSAARHGEASAIAPFQYLRLIVVAGFGWAIWGEVPDGWTWLGAAVIVSGALVITWAEVRRR